MSELGDRVAYIDATLEQAENALLLPEVREQFGDDRVRILGSYLGRIVPIISENDARRVQQLRQPDAIPLAVVAPLNSINFATGNGQMTSVQYATAMEKFNEWAGDNTIAHNPLDTLLARAIDSKDVAIPIVMRPKMSGGTMAASFAFLSRPLAQEFSLRQKPSGTLVRVVLRPLLYFSTESGAHGVDADVFWHELKHFEQKEQRPITVFSSQDQVDMSSLGDELHCYHVGSIIRTAIDGTTIDDTHARDPHLQLAVERIRLAYARKSNKDPFEANHRLLTLLEKAGFARDWMLHSRINFRQVVAGLQPQEATLSNGRPNSKAKKGGRYTPPKSK